MRRAQLCSDCACAHSRLAGSQPCVVDALPSTCMHCECRSAVLPCRLQAGMGGGTGRGAAPVVADLARQQGAFTVAIAATPTSLTARQSSTQVCLLVQQLLRMLQGGSAALPVCAG